MTPRPLPETPGPSHPSRRQQDLSGWGGRRGRGRSLVGLVGLVALDTGHRGLEADLHHGCAGPRVRPAASGRAAALCAASICTAAARLSAGTGSLDRVGSFSLTPPPARPAPAPPREGLGVLRTCAPFPPAGLAVTPAGRAAPSWGSLKFP